MKKKKRNKKYNPVAAQTRHLEHALKDVVVTYSGSTKDSFARLYNLKTMEEMVATHSVAIALTDLPFFWDTTLLVLCRRQDGQQYFQELGIRTQQPIKQSELSEFLTQYHAKLLDEANPMHVLNVAWISSPVSRQVTTEEIDRILLEHNAWAYSTKYEWTQEHPEEEKSG